MSALAGWSLLTLLAVLVGYAIIVVGAMLAPMIAPVLREAWREAWRARRERREGRFFVLLPYPVYLLRYRRVFLLLLLVPPALLILAWLTARA